MSESLDIEVEHHVDGSASPVFMEIEDKRQNSTSLALESINPEIEESPADANPTVLNDNYIDSLDYLKQKSSVLSNDMNTLDPSILAKELPPIESKPKAKKSKTSGSSDAQPNQTSDEKPKKKKAAATAIQSSDATADPAQPTKKPRPKKVKPADDGSENAATNNNHTALAGAVTSDASAADASTPTKPKASSSETKKTTPKKKPATSSTTNSSTTNNTNTTSTEQGSSTPSQGDKTIDESASKPKSSSKKKTPASSAGDSEAPPSTPVKSKDGSAEPSKKKKRASPGSAVMSSAVKKKKIADLEQSIITMTERVDELKKDAATLDKSLKAAAARAAKAAPVKYPVKDELLASVCSDSPPMSLPDPKYPFSLPPELFGDVISIWEFLSTFRLQLSLPSISLEGLIDVLTFTRFESVALTEIFCAPLRVLLCDHQTTAKVQTAIPKYTNFTHRPSAAEIAYFAVNKDAIRQIPSSSDISGLVSSFGPPSADCDFDTSYNGLHLLPRRLLPRLVDPLRWQSVLRCILMKLEPVNALQRAFRTVPVDTLSQLFCSGAADNDILSEEASLIPSSPMAGTKTQSFVAETRSPTARISSEGRLIMTPGGTVRKKGATVNKDVVLGISTASTCYLATVCDAARFLEENELHAMSVEHKVVILKTLCDACYDTSHFRHLLETHAEERANSIIAMNKAIRDSKLRQKEVSAAKRDAAIAACREINRKAAEAASNKKSSKKKAAPAASANAGAIAGANAGANAGASGDSSGDVANKEAASASTVNEGGKKAAKVKDPFEPSQSQLAAMLEEMLLLESIGVDEVVDDLTIEIPPELTSVEESEDVQYLSRVQLKGERNKEQERRRLRYELQSKFNAVENAKTMLTNAVEGGIEKDIKRAIKAAEKAELKWEDDDGKVFCTELLKQAYKIHLSQEAKAKEEREMVEYDKDLLKFCTRTTPLGFDRFNNAYWHFAGCADILFVQKPTVSPGSKVFGGAVAASSNGKKAQLLPTTTGEALDKLRTALSDISTIASSSSNTKIRQLLVNHFGNGLSPVQLDMLIADPTTIMLYQSRPQRVRYQWGAYCTTNALWAIWEALDDRGERERELKATIKATFDLLEPPTVYMTTGSEYIGRKVRRKFGKKTVVGTITGWVPAEGEDVALWHVEHIDGDEEDLEEHEVMSYLVDLDDEAEAAPKTKLASSSSSMSLSSMVSRGSTQGSAKASTAVAAAVASSSATGKPPKKDMSAKKSSIVGEDEWDEDLVLKPKKQRTSLVQEVDSSSSNSEDDEDNDDDDDDDNDDEEEEIEVPKIIRSFSGVGKNHVPVKGFMIGMPGLRAEMLRNYQLLIEALKKKSPLYSKEARKAWENGIKDAETLEDVKAALLELEVAIHAIQQVTDVMDEEEIAREKEEDKQAMITEGWAFDSTAHEFIGMPARRFFKSHGLSDGVVVAYLPPDRNEGVALWHMEHEDGDEEDLYEVDVRKALRQREDELKEDDEVDDNDSASDEAESEESEEESEEEDRGNKKVGVVSGTLWPTSGVRSRWMSAVNRCSTIGEVALSLSALMDFALSFGVVSNDPLDTMFTTTSGLKDKKYQSTTRLSYCGPSSSSSSRGERTPLKRKAAGGYDPYDRSNMRRAATRNVSYADY